MNPNSNKYLAWYIYPKPKGREYTETALENPAVVKEVFDYCQLLLATISKYGWKKLIQFHGLDELLRINEDSGWFDNQRRIEVIDSIKYECLISGYDPEFNEFGEYDDQSGIFKSEKCNSRLVKWATSWQPKK